MKIRAFLVSAMLAPLPSFAQSVPAPVPQSEVFTREQIGHALAQPTPDA
ncbi:MAG: hypothetical protein JWO52_2605, partial [Gammaproteobacteria bacterium]|nr:hypothetical protein [Gammaproteobacteria bacterium]